MKQLTFFTFVFLLFCLLVYPQNSRAASIFDEYTLEGHAGNYLVKKKGVKIRKTPSNTGKTLGKLNPREIIKVLGIAKGTQWAAVRKNEKDMGFVYAFSLTPIIDASFSAPLTGQVDLRGSDKPECSYQVTFEGRYKEEEVVFISSDYLAHFQCQGQDNSFDFTAMMFMSEVPHDLGQKPVFQITMNLPDVATGYEEFLSATTLYHQKKNEVVMDAVSLKAFKEKDQLKRLPANNVKEALASAIKLQLDSFNHKAWQTIAGEIPAPGEAQPD